ncbi:hypothetical protein [Streptomyces sp. NEAU-L66]|uniref:hypothetical protein n=1 Tax=Streptomyces sp. NEAU-L66 TaxID=3390812 RepID=UPI0039C6B1C9
MTGNEAGNEADDEAENEAGNQDRAARAEQLRAGFQRQGAPGLAEDEVRKDRQRRSVHTVVAMSLGDAVTR